MREVLLKLWARYKKYRDNRKIKFTVIQYGQRKIGKTKYVFRGTK